MLGKKPAKIRGLFYSLYIPFKLLNLEAQTGVVMVVLGNRMNFYYCFYVVALLLSATVCSFSYFFYQLFYQRIGSKHVSINSLSVKDWKCYAML